MSQKYLSKNKKNMIVLLGMDVSKKSPNLFEKQIFREIAKFLTVDVQRFSSFHDTVVFGTEADLEFFFVEKKPFFEKDIFKAINFCMATNQEEKVGIIRQFVGFRFVRK